MTSRPQANHRKPSTATPQTGFTLIELLVTVAIVAILAMIAYPTYTNQIAKARRAEMEAELMSLAGFMERIYTETGCYNPGPDMVCAAPAQEDMPEPDDDAPDDDAPDIMAATNNYTYYEISFSKIGADEFELKAKPTPGTAQVEDGVLYINELGERWRDESGEEDATGDGATGDGAT